MTAGRENIEWIDPGYPEANCSALFGCGVGHVSPRCNLGAIGDYHDELELSISFRTKAILELALEELAREQDC